MKALSALLMVTLALPAWSTDKHIPNLDRDSDHSREWTAALIGAGITWFVMHRRAKRRPPDVRIVPAECPVVQCPTVPTCEVQTERVLRECVTK